MSPDELLDASLALGVQVLEFVHSRELADVEAVGGHQIWGGRHNDTWGGGPPKCLGPSGDTWVLLGVLGSLGDMGDSLGRLGSPQGYWGPCGGAGSPRGMLGSL